jgi:hypothetical protein
VPHSSQTEIQEAKGLAATLKEKGDALTAMEGQLTEERTTREGAQS